MDLYKHKHAWILGGFEYLHADDLIANPGSGGATFRTDQLGTGQHVPFTKLMDGTADSAAVIPGDATSGLYVQVKASTLPTGAATAAKQPALGTAGSSSTDVLSVQGIASGTALPISAAALPLPSGAATETTLAALNTKTPAAKTSDYDTGAGTDTVPMMGIALPASGGAVQGGTATNPVRTDPTGTTAQPITDNSGSLTVDSPQLPSSLGQTTMAASVSVALASNQSALPITDNSGSLTVDNGGTFAVQADGSVASGSADSGAPVKVGGKYNSSPITLTNGQRGDAQLDANGYIKVNVAAGGASGGTSSSFGSAFPATGTALGAKDSAGTNMAALNLDASGYLKVNVAAGGGSGGTALADKAAFTEGTTSMTPIGGVLNETISADPTEDQAAAVRITAKRALHVNLRDSSGNELTAGAQYAEDSVHASGDQVTVAGVVRKDTATQTAGTDGDYSVLVNDANGRLHVNVGAVPADPFGANADAASATGSISAKLRFIAATGIPITGTVTVGSHAVTNAGTFATQDSEKVADNAAFTDGTTKVLPAGFIFDEVAGTALTENDAGAARMDSKRAIVNVLEDATTRGQRAAVSAAGALSVTDIPATSGGWAISTLLSAATTNATSAKGSAGQVGGWYLYNANAAVRYFKLYNKASSPTVGTDVPVMTIPIPPGSAANVEFGKGIAFATGIAFAITTGATTADTGAVAANEIIVNLLYK